jgi:HK97 family phage prohead protease
MTDELIERAAQARAAGMRAVADRPKERRNAPEQSSLVASRAVVRRPIEVREAGDGTGLDFSGYASVTESGYEMYDFFGPYTEVVSRGAFAKSLSTENLDVPLVLGHDSMRRIARTTNGSLVLTEDETGLRADAPALDPTDADVAYIAPKLRSGLIDEMSFRFSIDAGTWSPDYTEYRIDVADINRGDVSIVGYGANPATSAALRAAMEAFDEPLTLEERVAALTDADFLVLQRAIGTHRRARGIRPAMTLHDLLSIKD